MFIRRGYFNCVAWSIAPAGTRLAWTWTRDPWYGVDGKDRRGICTDDSPAPYAMYTTPRSGTRATIADGAGNAAASGHGCGNAGIARRCSSHADGSPLALASAVWHCNGTSARANQLRKQYAPPGSSVRPVVLKRSVPPPAPAPLLAARADPALGGPNYRDTSTKLDKDVGMFRAGTQNSGRSRPSVPCPLASRKTPTNTNKPTRVCS